MTLTLLAGPTKVGKAATARNAPRRREYPYKIPKVDPHVVEAVQEWIVTRRGSRRPPELSAKFLACVVEMYERNQPFPPRRMIADALGTTSDDSIDAARTAALYNNEISEVTRTPASPFIGEAKRAWVYRERYYVPGSELMSVVRAAKEEAQKRREALAAARALRAARKK